MAAMHFIARNLAAAFLTGPWDLAGLLERGARAVGGKERWLRPLSRRIVAAFGDGKALPDELALARLIHADDAFRQALLAQRSGERPKLLRGLFWTNLAMRPATGAPATWELPSLATPADLAAWLGLSLPQLDWFARRRGSDVPPGPLRHYTYRWITKPSGKARLLEVPRPRLRALQRRLLHDLLDHIPPHTAAHGYCRGCSIATYAAPHCGRRIVLRFDLRDFFPPIRAARVHAFFRTAGYPRAVARLLTGLCTNAVPSDVLGDAPAARPEEWPSRQVFHSPHLPQGAPTSPALANLCAFRLDCRLAALAESVGAGYTRYADDLAFSGDERLERCARRFQVGICRIALEEGFQVRTIKSRFMRRGIRQQLTGVVVNAHPNIRRSEFDCLKATLHNCVRHGPRGQDRDGRTDFRAYLAGRIAYIAMLNPTRGRKLRALFDRIRWEEE